MISRSLFTMLMFLASAAAHCAPLDVSLDFNDNAIPSAWSIRPGPLNTGSNYRVAGGRFYAGQVDSSAFLSLAYSPSPGVAALDIEWDGSVFQTYWGNNEGVEVVDDHATRFLARTESNSYLYGDGILVHLGSGTAPIDKLPLASGSYHFHTRYIDGSVQFSAAMSGTEVFSYSLAAPGLVLADLTAIELVVYETLGPESWLDNVHIGEQVSAVPEPSTVQSLAAGLLVIAIVFARRRKPFAACHCSSVTNPPDPQPLCLNASRRGLAGSRNVPRPTPPSKGIRMCTFSQTPCSRLAARSAHHGRVVATAPSWRGLRSVLCAALAGFGLAFGLPAFAQLGDVFNQIKQAAESARQAVDSTAQSVRGAAALPSLGNATGCLQPTSQPGHFTNNCGIDVTILFPDGKRNCMGRWLMPEHETAIANTFTVCSGRADRGPACACQSGSEIDNPAGKHAADTRPAPSAAIGRQHSPDLAAQVRAESPGARTAQLNGVTSCLRELATDKRGRTFVNECDSTLTVLAQQGVDTCRMHWLEPKRATIVSGNFTVCEGKLDQGSRSCSCS